MHPNASERWSYYIKASIFSGFYSGGAIVVTYLFAIARSEVAREIGSS